MSDPTDWNILVIDDEPDNLSILAFVFSFQHIRFRTADNGTLGLTLLHEEKPTLVLLDLQMPRLSGWDILRIIREDSTLKDLPVFAITAFVSDEQRQKAIAAGFDGFIAKPIKPRTFVDELNVLLQAKSGN